MVTNCDASATDPDFAGIPTDTGSPCSFKIYIRVLVIGIPIVIGAEIDRLYQQ